MYNTLNTTTKSLNFFSSLHNAEVKTIGASSAFFCEYFSSNDKHFNLKNLGTRLGYQSKSGRQCNRQISIHYNAARL